MSDSRQLLITLGLNTDSFTTNMKRANDLLKESKSSFQRVSEVSEVLEKSLDGLGVKQQFLVDNLNILNAKSQLYADRVEETKNALEQEKNAFSELGLKIKELVGDNNNLSALNKEQLKELKGLQQQYDKSEKAITKYNKRLLDTQSSYNLVRKEIASTMKDIQECSFAMEKFSDTQKLSSLKESVATLSKDFERSKLSLENFGKTYESIEVIQQNFNMRLRDHNEIMKISEREINRLGVETVGYKNRIEELKNSIGKLKSEQKNYTDTSEKSTAIYKNLEKEIAELENEQAKYVKQVEISEERIKELNSTYETSNIETLKLKKSSKELSEQLKKLDESFVFEKAEKSFQELTNETIVKLEKKLKDLNLQFKKNSDSVIGFETSAEGLEAKLSNLNKQIRIVQKEMQTWDEASRISARTMGGLARSIKAIENQIVENNSKIASSDAKTKDVLRSSNIQLMKDLDGLKVRLEEQKAFFDKSKVSIIECDKSISSLGKSVLLTKEKIKEMVMSASDLSYLDERLKSLTEVSIQDLNNKLQKLDQRFKILSASSKEFGKNEQTLKESISTYNSKLKLSIELMDAYNTKVLESKQKIEVLTSERQQLIASIKKEVEELKKDKGQNLDSRIAKIKELKEKYEELKTELEQENRALNEGTLGFERMQVEIGKIKRNIDEANISLRKFGSTDKIRICSEQIEVLKQKFDTLSSKIELATSRSSLFGIKLGEVNKTFAIHKQRVEAIREVFDRYGVQLSATQNKLTTLKTAQELLSEKIEKTKVKLKEESQATGTSSERYLQLKSTLFSLSEQYDKLNSEILKTEKNVDELKAKLMSTSSELRTAIASAEGGRLALVQSQFKSLGRNITSVGDKLRNTGYQFQMLSMVATLSLGAIIKSGSEYEQAMANLSAVLGIKKTSEAYKELDKTSKEWSKNSIFSAKEVSQGLLQIAQNGFDTQQSIGMLTTELQTAQASGMDLAHATELSISALDTMGHRGTDALQYLPRMMNDVAITANKSSGNIKDLLAAINQGGGLANQFHISIEQLSAMLGILANQGLKGEQAGRSLNSVLINLTRNSGQSAKAMKVLSKRIGLSHNLMYDNNGKLLPITQGLGNLRRALKGLNEEQQFDILSKLGGKTQIRAFLTLLNHMTDENGNLTKSYKDLYNEISDPKNSNALKTMSDTMSNTFEGQFKKFKAISQTVATDLFETLKPTLTSLLKTVNDLLLKFDGWLNKLTPKQKKMFSEVLLFCATVAPLLIGLGTGVKLIGFAIGGLLTPIKLVADGFKILFGSKKILRTAEELEGVGKELTSLQKKAKVFEKFKTITKSIGSGIATIIKGIGKIGLAIGKGIGKILIQIPKAIGTIGRICGTFGGKVLRFVLGMPTKIFGIVKSIGRVIKSINLLEKAMALLDIVMEIDPVILAITAVIALVGVLAYEIHKHWKTIKPYFEEAKKKVGDFCKYASKELSKLGNAIGGFFKRLPSFFGGLIYGYFGNLKESIGTEIKGFIGIFKGMGHIVEGIFSLSGKKIKKGLKELISSGISLFTNPLHKINYWIGVFNSTMRLFGQKYHIGLINIKKLNADLAKNVFKVCNSIEKDFKSIPKNISKNWKKFKKDMSDSWTSTKTWWGNNLKTAENGISSWWTGVKKNSKTSFNQMCKDISDSWTSTKTWWSNVFASAQSGISSWWTGVKTNSSTSFNQMCQELSQSWGNAKTWWGNTCSGWYTSFTTWWGNLKTTNSQSASEMWSELSSSMSNAIPYLSNGAASIGGAIKDELNKLPGQLYSIGANIMNSFFDGIRSIGNNIGSWVSNHVNSWKQDFGNFGNLFLAMPNGAKNTETHSRSRRSAPSLAHMPSMFAAMPMMFAAMPKEEKPTIARVSLTNGFYAQPTEFDVIGDYMSGLSKSIKSSFQISNYQTNGNYYKPQNLEKPVHSSNDETIAALLKNQSLIISLLSKSDKVTNINFSVGSKNVAQACYDEFGRIIEKGQASRNIAKGWK